MNPDTRVALLVDGLCRKDWGVAIQHFLQLRKSGASVPALLERSCTELLRQRAPTLH